MPVQNPVVAEAAAAFASVHNVCVPTAGSTQQAGGANRRLADATQTVKEVCGLWWGSSVC